MEIVLDRSGSMRDSVAGTPKWTSAVAAVRGVTQKHESQIRFGLELFTGPAQCEEGTLEVAIADRNASAIEQALPAIADGQGTPIGASLRVAATAPGLVDAQRSSYVLLITDGMENCGGDPVEAVKALFDKGIKTYVVGFGGEVDQSMLSSMAKAGGTARSGSGSAYFQADDAASLNQAVDQIAQGAIGCDFQLGKAPPDVTKIFVYVDGTLAPHDPAKANGWEYTAATQRVTLYGPTCDAVSNHLNAKVSVVYGCPDDTLVEGPGNSGNTDAGTSSDADGGVPIF